MDDYKELVTRCEGWARPLFMLNDRALNGGEDISFKLDIDPVAASATAILSIRGDDKYFSVRWDEHDIMRAKMTGTFEPRFESDVKGMITKCVFMVMQRGAFSMLEG